MCNDGVLKYSRNEDDNIIISDYTLSSLFPPQLKQKPTRYKVMCGCECFISVKSIHSSLLPWRDSYFKNSNIKAKMLKAEGLVKKHIHKYETYKNTVMPHGCHSYAKVSDMAKATMCTYRQYYHAIPHWKCVLLCCAECPYKNLPDQ